MLNSDSISNSPNISLWQHSWWAPSNLALIKYWGKKNGQFPINPSLSFSLRKCGTFTTVSAFDNWDGLGEKVQVTFAGVAKPQFASKLEKILHALESAYPEVSNLHFKVETKNTFPFGAGLASSASSMAAFTLCVLQGIKLYSELPSFLQLASSVARMGSGSACRSLAGGFNVWGQTQNVPGSCDQYAVSISENTHPVFLGLKNAICIVSDIEKAVSSSDGHKLMDQHPGRELRCKNAADRLKRMLSILQQGDLFGFCEVVEEEALELHALMLTSKPSILLWQPQSIQLIHEVRAFRKRTQIPLSFTFDAGPNMHLLYFKEHQNVVETWIKQQITPQLSQVIFDEVDTLGPMAVI